MIKQICITLFFCALGSVLRADEPADRRLPLDKLLETPISTAAKYDQQLSSVAASVTIITAEEIERYGWTNLAEAMEAVRGLYLAGDRNYASLGVRGFSLPSDFNSRILLLLDGTAATSPAFGEAPMGSILGIDLGIVERIEIVRGPGSALYGDHAMLAVINIITKNADAIDGIAASVAYGSWDRRSAAFRAGKVFANGLHLTASANWQGTKGDDLYFPEFDSPATHNGIANGLDYEELHSFALGLEIGDLRLSAFSRSRTKGIPTGSYSTLFNVDSNATVKDDLATAEYHLPVGIGRQLELKGTWQRSRYRGYYPYEDIGVDHSYALSLTGQARFQWDIRPNQRLTVGTEVIDHRRAEYHYNVGAYSLDLVNPYTQSSWYLQHEYHPSPKLGFVMGVRHDAFSRLHGTTNPRLAVLYTPTRSTTLKVLYGSAFRAPNIFEAEFADPNVPWKKNPDLKTETVRTAELVVEQRLTSEIFVVGSAFHTGASGLVSSDLDPTDQTFWYRNLGTARSDGVEMEIDLRRENGLWAHVNYSTQKATDDGERVSNSPTQLLKAGISTSPWNSFAAALDAIYESDRLTRDGGKTDGFLVLNSSISKRISDKLRFSLSVRNLLDTDYSTPVSAEQTPQAIQQNGRSFLLKLTYTR